MAKTVQTWVHDVKYPKHPVHEARTGEDNDYYVVNPVMFKLTKKLQRVLRMDLTPFFSSVAYQVTNYGLGGLCEPHMDPHGYLEGVELPPSRQDLVHSGDILGTFMGYLNDVESGGATTFLVPGKEVTVWPRKGSAAFWISLKKSGARDMKTTHGGCPVLRGSKWILNKWVYLFDQFKEYPCGLKSGDMFQGFTKHY